MIKYLVLCIAAPLVSSLAGGIISKLGMQLPLPRECKKNECKRASFYSFFVSALLCLSSLVAAVLALTDGYRMLAAVFTVSFLICLAVAWCCFALVCEVDDDGKTIRQRDVLLRWRKLGSDESETELDGESGGHPKKAYGVYTAVYLSVAVILVLAVCIITVSTRPYKDIREGKEVFSYYAEADGVLFPLRADGDKVRYLVLDYRECISDAPRLIAEIAEGKEFGIKYAVLHDDKWEGQYVLLEIVGEDGTVFLSEADAMENRSGSAYPSIIFLGIMSAAWLVGGAWLLFLPKPKCLYKNRPHDADVCGGVSKK